MLPDIDLYMDQVLALSEKYFGAFSDSNEVGITSSMLNNYVKQKVIPSPDKKRYNKEHLARFLMICILKRVLSIAKIKQLLDSGVLMQVNATFFTSVFTKGRALSMLKKGTVHLIGSDCHGTSRRPPYIKKAYDIIEKKIGADAVNKLISFSHSLIN